MMSQLVRQTVKLSVGQLMIVEDRRDLIRLLFHPCFKQFMDEWTTRFPCRLVTPHQRVLRLNTAGRRVVIDPVTAQILVDRYWSQRYGDCKLIPNPVAANQLAHQSRFTAGISKVMAH